MVARNVALGPGTVVWDLTQVREGATVGASSILGRNVYIDHDVRIGQRCKIQNNALVYWPAEIEDGVFIGPGAILTNDRHPRAIDSDGQIRGADDWEPLGVTIRYGASVGAGAVILGGVTVGAWALIAAGSMVTRDVPAHGLMAGNPATQKGWVGRSGRRLVPDHDGFEDPANGVRYRLSDNGMEMVS